MNNLTSFLASSNRNFYSLNFVISRSYKVPGKLKNKVNLSKVPEIDFKNDVQEIFTQASGPGGMNLNHSKNKVTLILNNPTKLIVHCQDERKREQNLKIARERLIDKLDNWLNKEESVENQVKQLLKIQGLRNKRNRAKRREEKALEKANLTILENNFVVDAETPSDPTSDFPEEKYVDSSLSEADNESRHICSSVKSNDWKDGMEKPT